ncbi:hypothetical protein [Pyruvatibacter mobilis]|uniref:hypothetical protein n=1 Tax=Pyruvatibacter mobilis TaxID=1712261 RepID=UPI003BAB8273
MGIDDVSQELGALRASVDGLLRTMSQMTERDQADHAAVRADLQRLFERVEGNRAEAADVATKVENVLGEVRLVDTKVTALEVRVATLQREGEEIKSWRWRVAGYLAGVGTAGGMVGAVLTIMIRRLFGG